MAVTLSHQKIKTPSPALMQVLASIHSDEQSGRLSEAFSRCEQLLDTYPDDPRVLHYLGVLSLQLGQVPAAVNWLQRAVTQHPRQALSHNYLGVAFCQQGQLDDAIAAYKRALTVDPKLHEAHYNLGLAYMESEKFQEAERHLTKALASPVKTPALHYNLAVILHRHHKNQLAITHYKQALALKPDYFNCAVNLGAALFETNQVDEAIAIYTQALTRVPGDAHIHEKLAIAHSVKKNHSKALENLLKIKPRGEAHYYLLHEAYVGLKNPSAAIDVLEQALRFYPKNLSFLLLLIWAQKQVCYWDQLEVRVAKLLEGIDAPEYLYKYAVYFILGYSVEDELRFAKKLAEYVHQKLVPYRAKSQFIHQRHHNKKLRIGYLSANVRIHPEAYMIRDLCPSHDPEACEVFLYSAEKPDDSEIARALIATAPHFVNLHGLSVTEAAARIYKDKIDILIDLSAYWNLFSTFILGLRPAKIQMSLFAHHGTKQVDFFDYMILDKCVVQKEEEKYFSEKIIYMPDTFFLTTNQQSSVDTTREALNLPQDKFLFCCLNFAEKYDPTCFAAWMKILAQVENSMLVLLVKDEATQLNLFQSAKKYGMHHRLIYFQGVPKEQHMGRMKVLDLFIDSFKCTAHTTAMDALFAGLPVLTLYGNNITSRGGSSVVSALHLPELIAYNVEEYIQKAVHYATHPGAIATLRRQVAENSQTAPLFKPTVFVKNLEKAYRLAWEKYVNHEAPAHIDVGADQYF